MEFHNNFAEIFVPEGTPALQALARTTHLAIAAHEDDIEIMAIDGILQPVVFHARLTDAGRVEVFTDDA